MVNPPAADFPVVAVSGAGRRFPRGACILWARHLFIPLEPEHVSRRPAMARVTVEDCVDKVENRFELVLLAGHRARMIASGSSLTVPRDNDKNPVVALRE